MSQRKQIYLLIGLVVVLVAVYVFNRDHARALAGPSSGDVSYRPLNIQDPALRLELLEGIRKLEYSGTHRNIFSAEPPPIVVPAAPAGGKPGTPGTATSQLPAEPPPLDVPVTFFGYASNPRTGKRQAFFTNGDDVFIVAEGQTLLNRFRLLKIGNSTADLEEVSSGRRATVNMEQPPATP